MHLEKTVSREDLVLANVCHADLYLNGGIVEYRGMAKVKEGRNVLPIAGISANADPAKVQMRFDGSVQSCHILGVETLHFEEKQALRELRNRIRDIQEELEILDFQFEAWKKGAEGELVKKNLEKATGYLESLPERLLRNRRAYFEKGEALEALEQELEAAEKEEANQNAVPVLRAEVNASKEGICHFSLTAEDDTTWAPFYELQVESVQKPLLARLRATIRPAGGKDWEEVSLRLIYGKRNREGTKPNLRPWVLDPPPAVPRPNMMMGMGMAMARAAMPMEDTAMEEAPIQNLAAPPAPKTEVVSEVLSQYLLPGTYHLARGTETVLDVLETEIPAEYRYCTVPKLDPDVFLTATVEKPDKYSLLPCRAFVSYAGLSVGEVRIPKESSGEPFVLSLGRDQGILTRREKKGDSRSEAALSGKQIRKLSYAIHVTNKKESEIFLEVRDQIPVARDEKIRVAATELSGGKLEADTGEVVWKTSRLGSGESVELTLAFTVTYPKTMHLSSL